MRVNRMTFFSHGDAVVRKDTGLDDRCSFYLPLRCPREHPYSLINPYLAIALVPDLNAKFDFLATN